MIGDTVREELQLNIMPTPRTVNVEKQAYSVNSGRLERPAPAVPQRPLPVRTITADLTPKNTNPTLVGFQTKAAAMPDWRLELQNKVRQRTGGVNTDAVATQPTAGTYQAHIVTSGANALKADYAAQTAPSPAQHTNPKVAAALKRIEQSRQKFLAPETAEAPIKPNAAVPNRNFPFNVVNRVPETAPRLPEKASVNVLPKPKLVSSLRVGKEILDTNKLPPLPVEARIATSFDRPFSSPAKEDSGPLLDDVIHIDGIEEEVIEEMVSAGAPVDVEAIEAIETDEIEDLAPVAVRFNAGLFDLIIGAFASLILLSPFVLMGGNWFTWAGVSAFLATFAVVMFIYLTTCLGLFGKTFGMRIFSLELVDIEESDYPTFHQAALSSTVSLISLALGGIGFLTVPFNEEKRAVHDLLSGTIIVKEF
jgi:uncharacterized RDD family membrane protein YckC